MKCITFNLSTAEMNCRYMNAIQRTVNKNPALHFYAAGKKRGNILNKKPSGKNSLKRTGPSTGKMVVKHW